MHIAIDRVSLTLDGVSVDLAQQALDGLEAEVRRRLRAWPQTGLPVPQPDDPVPVVLDVAALRGLIAERMVQALHDRLAPGRVER